MINLNWSLKWKVLTGVTLTSTVAVAVAMAIMLNIELRRLDEEINTEARTTAQLIGANSTGALAFVDATSATETLSTLSLNEDILAAVLFDENGEPFSEFTTSGYNPQSLPGSPGSNDLTRLEEEGYIELFEPVRMDGDTIGNIYLRFSLEERQQVLMSYIFSFILIVSAVAVISMILSYFIQRSVVGPVNMVRHALRDLAEGEGDLTRRINVGTDDEVGELAHWFNVFADRVHKVVGKFQDSAMNLTSSAGQLTSTIGKTAEGATKQQGELDHVAKAMNEMATTVEEVTRNVANAASDAEKADDAAKRGAVVVNENADSINKLATDIDNAAQVISQLQKETDSIGLVLDVIRGIAEQTNLLALNAAIEAARAGEQGRGFAVVADEVRTLASRTQSSTEEIQEMIEKLQNGANQAVEVMQKGRDQTATTVERANEAGESLQSITQAVTVIKDMNNQIASASEEQSAVTEEMKHNINNIAEVAVDTASGSREITDGANELSRLAEELKTLVGQFRV